MIPLRWNCGCGLTSGGGLGGATSAVFAKELVSAECVVVGAAGVGWGRVCLGALWDTTGRAGDSSTTAGLVATCGGGAGSVSGAGVEEVSTLASWRASVRA